LRSDGTVNRILNPDTSQSKLFYVVENGTHTVTVWGDASAVASSGETYQILDFRLEASSPCVNAGGANQAPSDDLDGKTRDATPDIGAYER
jgi:hypothetical protein